MREISVVINGSDVQATVSDRLLLSDFIRDDQRLTGTHVGCEHGYCGSCTVLLDGASVRSCLTLAVQTDGHVIETVESLAVGVDLHPIQEAFRSNHGLQCGFCTPGLLMTTLELAREVQVNNEIRGATGRQPLQMHWLSPDRRCSTGRTTSSSSR